MSDWAPKRFWNNAEVSEAEGGLTILLDGRPVNTPAKAPLILPTRTFAEAVAAEWQAQGDRIRPETMPLTRLANSAIDKVAPQFAEVADMLVAYGETDLLCHRADTPAELVARQAAIWDPALDWAEAELGARLIPTVGVICREQDPAALERLRNLTHSFDVFELAAFHDLVALSGSLILGLATVRGYDTPEAIWNASRVDETWQEEQWGADDEASALAALKRQAFMDAARAFRLLRHG